MSELIHIFVRLGWHPATVFCVVFVSVFVIGLVLAVVIVSLVRWIFESAFSK